MLSYAQIQITYDCVVPMESPFFSGSLSVICKEKQSGCFFVCPWHKLPGKSQFPLKK